MHFEKKYTLVELDPCSKKSFGGFNPNNLYQGILNFLFLSGFAGELDSDRMNELRNEKVKVKFFLSKNKFFLAIKRNFTGGLGGRRG